MEGTKSTYACYVSQAYFSLLPHYGFYGQDKRLIKGTTLKRLLAEVDKALGLTEQHEAITSAWVPLGFLQLCAIPAHARTDTDTHTDTA